MVTRRTLAEGYQLVTKPEHHQELREVVENLPPPGSALPGRHRDRLILCRALRSKSCNRQQ